MPGTVLSVRDPVVNKKDTIFALQEDTANAIMSKTGVRLAPMQLMV